MGLKASLVSERQHFVVDAGGVPDAQDIHPTIHQFLRNPVHRHIALGTHQYLRLTAKCLVNGFHEGGGLARSRRTMHDGHILGSQHAIDRLLLGGVQIRETHWVESEMLGIQRFGIEQIAQVGQSVVLGLDDLLQCVGHRAVTGLVKRKLHTETLRVLQFYDAGVVGNGHHHAITVNIAHRGGVFEVFDGSVVSRSDKERHWPSELEVLLNVFVGGAEHLHHQLVQAVVVAAPHTERPPGIAPLDETVHPACLRLLAEGLALALILNIEQQALLQQLLEFHDVSRDYR